MCNAFTIIMLCRMSPNVLYLIRIRKGGVDVVLNLKDCFGLSVGWDDAANGCVRAL